MPGIFGLFFIFFAIVEISDGRVYPARGAKIIVAAQSPISFRVLVSVELLAGIALIGASFYRLRQRRKKRLS